MLSTGANVDGTFLNSSAPKIGRSRPVDWVTKSWNSMRSAGGWISGWRGCCVRGSMGCCVRGSRICSPGRPVRCCWRWSAALPIEGDTTPVPGCGAGTIAVCPWLMPVLLCESDESCPSPCACAASGNRARIDEIKK